MVVGLTADSNHRLLWEDLMADGLRQHGIKTVATSLSAFPRDSKIDEKEIIDHVKSKGIEGVLVTRLVDTKTEEVYVPTGREFYGGPYGFYNHFGSYYTYSYNRTYSSGYTTTQEVVLLETNLYESKNQELIWTMSSDTTDARSVIQLIESVSKKVLATLKKDQLI